ncbi:hypothetical protein A3862_27190 [Methylobacterium sp. XJLW]|uniref:hypothetical protein n=1 Tax=Methylobacterium sp. XJLW TaxID=739141 RepID=UPI000DAADA9C|nr:hypothetical protein [Methylobacterium sp. XJLW]AWV18769.1 hypothetical protein A3862_27190 [Methylobacterium sp. XJLW]
MLESPATDPGRAAEEAMRDWSGFSGCGVHQVRGRKEDIDLVKRWCEQAASIPALQERIRSTQRLLADCQQKLRTTEATVAVARALNEAAEQEAAQLRARLREAEKGEARAGSEYADAMDARMEDAAHMETLRVAVLVLAECKIGSGLAAVREWFADGMRGPIQWPEGTLFAAWADEHDIYDCNGAMGFRRRDRGRAALGIEAALPPEPKDPAEGESPAPTGAMPDPLTPAPEANQEAGDGR